MVLSVRRCYAFVHVFDRTYVRIGRSARRHVVPGDLPQSCLVARRYVAELVVGTGVPFLSVAVDRPGFLSSTRDDRPFQTESSSPEVCNEHRDDHAARPRAACAPPAPSAGLHRTRPATHPRARATLPQRDVGFGAAALAGAGSLLLLAAVAAAFGGFTFLGDPAASTGTEPPRARRAQVVVEPGQRLWEIAQQVAPGEDTRAVIDEIVELNALSSAGEIRAGEPSTYRY